MNESIGLPSGFRDVLFDEARGRRQIESKLATVFENAGYGEIIPSSIEFFETYLRGNEVARERAYRFLNRDDILLALRADFTLSVARIAATRLAGSLPPYRVWYCGNVFRKVDASRGNYKETSQAGAELLGINSATSDVEILRVALNCLAALGIDDVQLHLNHAGIFKGIADALGLDVEALRHVKSEIDRKDTRSLALRLRELGANTDLAAHLDLLSRSIGDETVLAKAEKQISVPASLAAINELRQIADALAFWRGNLTFDLTEIDEMEYYTGVFFSFFSPKLKHELGRGGRYDNMLAGFGAPMPAVGFSFSMDELVRLV